MHSYLLTILSLITVCCSCGGKWQDRTGSLSGQIQKISVGRDQVFDLSGYADEGGGNPYNLFDENAYVDPRNKPAGEPYIPSTNCQPTQHPEIYFASGKGSRIVVDLLVPYALKEIYLFDRSAVNDSVWIYTGSLKQWKPVAALETVSDAGARGWRKLAVDERSRFVMIRFSSYETGITEMVLYGTPLESQPPLKQITSAGSFTRKPLNRFLGVNYIMEDEPKWLKPFHYSRLYNFALDFDNDTKHQGEEVQFNMLHYGYYRTDLKKYVFDLDTLKSINRGNIWYSIRGVSKWMNDLGYTDKDRPLNRPGMNTEDPAAYSRHAEMMWHLAAFFGNTKVDTNLLSLSHEPRASGRGSMSLFENGNEEDAWWVGNKYCSPVEYYAQSVADLDGDEGKQGKRRGILHADPHSRLMMSGLAGLDTNRVKVYKFLSENLRKDGRFVWQGGIQYHYYCHANGKGISPEADSLRLKLMRVRDCSRRIAPEVECFLGENGYDKSQASSQATPILPGYSVSESQGIMLLRSINAAFFSGFDAYILYWLKDGNPENDPRVYTTSGILRLMPDGRTIAYPGWYYISSLVNRLGNYLPDSVILEKGNVWIYRYRHQQFRDSVAYFVYAPTNNGTKIARYRLWVGNTAGNTVGKIEFSDDSDRGEARLLPVKQGFVSIPVDEKPRLVFSKEFLPSSH
ncbi:MAG: hypothetical protein Q8939_15265 [Bacteroidota bacterium]|nr:hypothetical protein [Bacteroidota bacterium]